MFVQIILRKREALEKPKPCVRKEIETLKKNFHGTFR